MKISFIKLNICFKKFFLQTGGGGGAIGAVFEFDLDGVFRTIGGPGKVGA